MSAASCVAESRQRPGEQKEMGRNVPADPNQRSDLRNSRAIPDTLQPHPTLPLKKQLNDWRAETFPDRCLRNLGKHEHFYVVIIAGSASSHDTTKDLLDFGMVVAPVMGRLQCNWEFTGCTENVKTCQNSFFGRSPANVQHNQ